MDQKFTDDITVQRDVIFFRLATYIWCKIILSHYKNDHMNGLTTKLKCKFPTTENQGHLE